MLTTAIMVGVALWLLERLAFALLLIWMWDALTYYTREVEAGLIRLWERRP
jgi:hypothetical protein